MPLSKQKGEGYDLVASLSPDLIHLLQALLSGTISRVFTNLSYNH